MDEPLVNAARAFEQCLELGRCMGATRTSSEPARQAELPVATLTRQVVSHRT